MVILVVSLKQENQELRGEMSGMQEKMRRMEEMVQKLLDGWALELLLELEDTNHVNR